MSKVYVKFPKTGLGNLLLIWARACVFARLNNLPMVTSPWWAIRPGAWLRNEKKKRLYWGYFKESTLLDRLLIALYKKLHPVVKEPPVKKLGERQMAQDTLFVFREVTVDNDLFGSLRPHKGLILKELNNIITLPIKNLVNEHPNPVIGIHIRRGDFKIANPLTPNTFFINGINLIREIVCENLPVTVFSDAEASEIQDILDLPQVQRAEEKPDIADILLLGKSKIMLISQSSSFSYWGAFLSEAIVIRPIGDWQRTIGPKNSSSNYQEISWDFNDIVSTDNLREKILARKHYLITKAKNG